MMTEEEIAKKIEWYDNLIVAIHTSSGQAILSEIFGFKSYILELLNQTRLKQLTAPKYEYSEDDLNKIRQYSTELNIVELILRTFDIEILENNVYELRERLRRHRELGESLVPAY